MEIDNDDIINDWVLEGNIVRHRQHTTRITHEPLNSATVTMKASSKNGSICEVDVIVKDDIFRQFMNNKYKTLVVGGHFESRINKAGTSVHSQNIVDSILEIKETLTA